MEKSKKGNEKNEPFEKRYTFEQRKSKFIE
jgi:hypothetical protein